MNFSLPPLSKFADKSPAKLRTPFASPKTDSNLPVKFPILQPANPFANYPMPFPPFMTPQAQTEARPRRKQVPKVEEDDDDAESPANEDRTMMLLLLTEQQKAIQRVSNEIREYKNPRLHEETQHIMQQLKDLQNEIGPTSLVSSKAIEKFSKLGRNLSLAVKPIQKSLTRKLLEALFGDTIDSEDEELFDEDLLIDLLSREGMKEKIRKRIAKYKRKERVKNQEFQKMLLSSSEPLLAAPMRPQKDKEGSGALKPTRKRTSLKVPDFVSQSDVMKKYDSESSQYGEDTEWPIGKRALTKKGKPLAKSKGKPLQKKKNKAAPDTIEEEEENDS